MSASSVSYSECEDHFKKKLRADDPSDRLSSLPDFVLQHILSFLPTKFAVRTSVLAKSWRYLWTGVTALDFDDGYQTYSYMLRYAKSVDKTLAQYRSLKIRKFIVHWSFRNHFQSRADSWVRFAVDRQVEELDLDFRGVGIEDCYELPCFLYSHSNLTKLTCRECYLGPSTVVDLPSLKDLFLRSTTLENDALATILSGCPALESLVLSNCQESAIRFRSGSLKEFILNNRSPSCVMEIWAPNLCSLTVHERWYQIQYKLIDVSSLVELRLESRVFEIQVPNIDRDLLIKMIELLQQLHRLEKLTLETWIPKKDITKRGRRSKILEERKAFWISQCTTFNCLQLTLKSVEIVNFKPQNEGWQFIDSLVEFLLSNALVLEKMVIHTENGNLQAKKFKKLLEAGKYISGYRRASPATEILVESNAV